MRATLLRTLVPAAACAVLLGAPAAARAANLQLPLPLPCVDAILIQVNCAKPPAGPECKDVTLGPTSANAAAIRSAVLCLLNKERANHHLAKLTGSASLRGAAKRFARQLVDEQFFEHVAPDGSTLVDRIRRTAYLRVTPHHWWLGENLAYGTQEQAQPAFIVTAWMRSPGHRANILNPHYRNIGIGIANGTPKTSYGATYVTDFGRRIRLASRPPWPTSNRSAHSTTTSHAPNRSAPCWRRRTT